MKRCAGSNCPKRDDCAKYRSYSRMPITTLHWWGIASGSCKHHEKKDSK